MPKHSIIRRQAKIQKPAVDIMRPAASQPSAGEASSCDVPWEGREISRAGITASDVDDAVLTVLEQSQFAQFCRHKTGHGLGLEPQRDDPRQTGAYFRAGTLVASGVPAPDISSVTASDGCGGAVTVTWEGDTMSLSNCVNQFTLTRTYKAADLCGNSATCTQTITVNDTTPPSITCPAAVDRKSVV